MMSNSNLREKEGGGGKQLGTQRKVRNDRC